MSQQGQARGRGGRGRGRGRGKRVGFQDFPPEDEIEQAEPEVPTEEPAEAEGEESKAAKRLKSVMKLSKLLAVGKKTESTSPWKKADLPDDVWEREERQRLCQADICTAYQ